MSVRELKILNYPMRVESEFITALHPVVEDELKAILKKSGSEDRIKRLLEQRLKHLENSKENCILHRQWFERYANEEWLYALRITDRDLNLRIYFSFINGKAVFLHAFLKRSNSDMREAKEVARGRLGEINQN